MSQTGAFMPFAQQLCMGWPHWPPSASVPLPSDTPEPPQATTMIPALAASVIHHLLALMNDLLLLAYNRRRGRLGSRNRHGGGELAHAVGQRAVGVCREEGVGETGGALAVAHRVHHLDPEDGGLGCQRSLGESRIVCVEGGERTRRLVRP